MSEAPADVLKEARQKIMNLMDMGISRDALLNLVATSNPTSPISSNCSNIPQQPLPTQSTDEVSREVKTERPADDGGLSRGMFNDVFPPKKRFRSYASLRPRNHGIVPGRALLCLC